MLNVPYFTPHLLVCCLETQQMTMLQNETTGCLGPSERLGRGIDGLIAKQRPANIAFHPLHMSLPSRNPFAVLRVVVDRKGILLSSWRFPQHSHCT